MRALFERRQLAVAHRVQDPAGILVAEVVQAHALPVPERTQRCRGELGREGKRLQASEDAVPAEHGHEPGEARRRKTAPTCDERREAQRREIDEAAAVGRFQRLRVALQPRCLVDPALEIPPHPQLSADRVHGYRPAAPIPGISATTSTGVLHLS